ncbi:MAG TPA: hypothetical protein VG778_04300 [Blastocatellia bacterium]|nr:hypothetical protein [Blastocatellia bacterium]
MSWFNRTRKRGQTAERVSAAPIDSAGRETRPASGYSLLELERAGLTEDRANEMGLLIDRKRHSAIGANVLQLKRLVAGR